MEETTTTHSATASCRLGGASATCRTRVQQYRTRRPQECRAHGAETNNKRTQQTCGNAEKTGQGP